MLHILKNNLKPILFPGGLFFCLFIGLNKNKRFNLAFTEFIDFLPLLIFSLILLILIRFHRSRYVYMLVTLAISERILHYHSIPNGTIDFEDPLVLMVSVLLPLNILFANLLKEKGFLTLHGLVRWSLLIGQYVGAWQLTIRFPEYVKNDLNWNFLGNYITRLFNLSSITIVAFTFAGLVILIKYLLSPSIPRAVSIWSIAIPFAMFCSNQSGLLFSKYFILIAVIMGFSTFETSYRLAYYDELTQLPGRRALNEMIGTLGNRYAIGMIDIDFFKKFNDTYGHDAGDQVLKMVAAKLNSIGESGKAFRYGGEEFTVIYPGKTKAYAAEKLDIFRNNLENDQFIIRSTFRSRKKPNRKKKSGSQKRKVKVTISIGVAERNAIYNTTGDVLKAADKALYRAKKGGRNQVVKSR